MCDEIEFLWIQGKFEFWLIPLAYLYINLFFVILAILQRLLEHVRFHHCLG